MSLKIDNRERQRCANGRQDVLLALAAAGYGRFEVCIHASEGRAGAYLVIYKAYHTSSVRPDVAIGASTEMHFEPGRAKKKFVLEARCRL